MLFFHPVPYLAQLALHAKPQKTESVNWKNKNSGGSEINSGGSGEMLVEI